MRCQEGVRGKKRTVMVLLPTRQNRTMTVSDRILRLHTVGLPTHASSKKLPCLLRFPQ